MVRRWLCGRGQNVFLEQGDVRGDARRPSRVHRNLVPLFVFTRRDFEYRQYGRDRRPERSVSYVSADADTSASTVGITHGVLIEFTVSEEESLGLESFRVGVFGFVTGHGPGDAEIRYQVQQGRRRAYQMFIMIVAPTTENESFEATLPSSHKPCGMK